MQYWDNLKNKLQDLVSTGEYRDLYINKINYDNNNKFLNFTSNDYFSLTNCPVTKKKAFEICENLPSGAGGSRLACPESYLYKNVENLIAYIKNTEAAIVTGSGYLNSIALLQAITSKNNLIIMDKYIHASWIDAIFTVKSLKFLRYKHNDLKDLEKLLQENSSKYKQVFILTETIFSMNGTVSNIGKILDLTKKYKAILIEDDAHGFGLVNIAHIKEHYTENNEQKYSNSSNYHIKSGTLSKAVGSYGGYIAASKTIINAIINFSRPVIFSTALPSFILAITYINLKKILKSIIEYNLFLERKELNIDNNFIHKLYKNIQYLQNNNYINFSNFNNHIFILKVKCPKKTITLQNILFQENILVTAVRYPTVPKGSESIRIIVSSSMNFTQLDKLLQKLNFALSKYSS